VFETLVGGRCALAAIGCALLFAVAPGAAGAATYTYNICEHPDNTQAPIDGLEASHNNNAVTTNDCGANGELRATLPNNGLSHAAYEAAAWKLTPPPGTTFAWLSALRGAYPGSDRAYGSPGAYIDTNLGTFEDCLRYSGCSGRGGAVLFDLSGQSWFRWYVQCGGGGECDPGETYIGLAHVTVGLNDESAPAFNGQPSGPLMSASTTQRSRTLNYTATDAGGGVYTQRLIADGSAVSNTIVDANGGKCGRYPTGDFSNNVPCKLSAAGSLTFDTTTLADGDHELRLEVFDVTEANRAVVGPWPILVDNAAPSVSAVLVSGTPRAGDTLTASADVAGQSPAVAFKWLRGAADGSGAQAIPGATGASYVLTDDDVGHKVMVTITATDHGGSTTRSSTATDPPFTGKVVSAYCTERPTGPRDACGDFDADGKQNRLDEDIDGDGTVNASDADPYDPSVPAKLEPSRPSSAENGTNGVNGTASANASASAAGGGPNGAAVNPNDPAAVALHNPLSSGGGNGDPVDDAAVISVRFERGAGTATRTTGRIVAGYGERVRLRGSITTKDGRPIRGAQIFLAKRAPGEASWKIDGSVVSHGDGSLQMLTSRGGRSRELRLVYFPHGGNDANRASNPLSLLIRQDASLTLSRRTLRNGQTLRFRGAVRGQIAAAGAQVQLQVKLRTGWYTFRRVTATRRAAGHVTSAYTFRRTTRPTHYQFRLKVIPRNTSSYVAGYSRTITVLVRP
jgi:hypothetical protein